MRLWLADGTKGFWLEVKLQCAGGTPEDVARERSDMWECLLHGGDHEAWGKALEVIEHSRQRREATK